MKEKMKEIHKKSKYPLVNNSVFEDKHTEVHDKDTFFKRKTKTSF